MRVKYGLEPVFTSSSNSRLQRIVAVPLHEEARITTFVLHKHQRFGLPDALQRFVAHAKTLH